MAVPQFYVAKESANFDFQGQPVFLTAGVTVVKAGHPILDGHMHLFEPLRVHWDMPEPEPVKEAVPEKEAESEESIPVNPHRADQRGARTRARPV